MACDSSKSGYVIIRGEGFDIGNDGSGVALDGANDEVGLGITYAEEDFCNREEEEGAAEENADVGGMIECKGRGCVTGGAGVVPKLTDIVTVIFFFIL